MPKQKACKKCKTIFSGAKCPKCGSEEASDAFKGRIFITNPQESEIAKKLKINEKGEYAIKT
ncbi:MAG: DNA-directed RNA polymerase subunit E'' [Nanoarchaeota archaeon]|nr:DNA-directed RNA polymerase subunit E'' [Nanoarchaeota archaeon]